MMSRLERNDEISRAAFEFNQRIHKTMQMGTRASAGLYGMMKNPEPTNTLFTPNDGIRAVRAAVALLKEPYRKPRRLTKRDEKRAVIQAERIVKAELSQ